MTAEEADRDRRAQLIHRLPAGSWVSGSGLKNKRHAGSEGTRRGLVEEVHCDSLHILCSNYWVFKFISLNTQDVINIKKKKRREINQEALHI